MMIVRGHRHHVMSVVYALPSTEPRWLLSVCWRRRASCHLCMRTTCSRRTSQMAAAHRHLLACRLFKRLTVAKRLVGRRLAPSHAALQTKQPSQLSAMQIVLVLELPLKPLPYHLLPLFLGKILSLTSWATVLLETLLVEYFLLAESLHA